MGPENETVNGVFINNELVDVIPEVELTEELVDKLIEESDAKHGIGGFYKKKYVRA